MQRNLDRLASYHYDVLVIGGGIHGSLAAWDAALRGLSVCLIERGDFGCETSQNSLKIIHGGLRYIQDGNPFRVRQMARERSIWMKTAPHLVHPLKCLMPTFPKLARGRLLLGFALALNDWISFDRNWACDPEKYLPSGTIISTEDCARLLPGYDRSDMTGAVVWHDAQVYNSERLLLAFLLSAAQHGADVANYVECFQLLRMDDRIIGVKARDVLTGGEFDIRAKIVINCAGAWIGQIVGKMERMPGSQPTPALSVAMNIIVDQVWSGCAAGIPSQPTGKKRSQVLFIVPWRNKTIIGTWHIPWPHPPENFRVDLAVLQDYLNEINSAHPGLSLGLTDIQHVQWGFLPAAPQNINNHPIRLVRDGKVIDHEKEDGIAGILTMIGVKFTTARLVAEQAIDLAMKKIGSADASCLTHSTPVLGGKIDHFRDFLSVAMAKTHGLEADMIKHFVTTYGSEYHSLVDTILENPALAERVDPDMEVTVAEIDHAVRHEMAQKLIDIVQRRTELGSTGMPSLTVLRKCAKLMAKELGWDASRQEQEVNSVIQAYPVKILERISN